MSVIIKQNSESMYKMEILEKLDKEIFFGKIEDDVYTNTQQNLYDYLMSISKDEFDDFVSKFDFLHEERFKINDLIYKFDDDWKELCGKDFSFPTTLIENKYEDMFDHKVDKIMNKLGFYNKRYDITN